MYEKSEVMRMMSKEDLDRIIALVEREYESNPDEWDYLRDYLQKTKNCYGGGTLTAITWSGGICTQTHRATFAGWLPHNGYNYDGSFTRVDE